MSNNSAHAIRDFHHPYTPYSIQETFMETVYEILEKSQVGILESPTGTGKSLSLICGALTWLRDYKRRVFKEGLELSDNYLNEPRWIVEQVKARKRQEMLRQREEIQLRLANIRKREKAQRDKYLSGEPAVKKRKHEPGQSDPKADEQFVLDDYESEQENDAVKKRCGGFYSAETLALLSKIGMGPAARIEEEIEEVEEEIKIYFCSRTHSQLTQFINELRRPKFPPSIQDETTKEDNSENLKHLTLGSRKNLCINPKVNRLNSVTAVNERCLELQESGTAKEYKCGFLPNQDNRPLVNTFRDHVFASIKDIEDMGVLGKEIGICPYYASRSAIKPAEIVTLPYPLLLQRGAREALGINLKGHVIIIDEAHNLIDAISSINGAEISLKQLQQARAQLGIYLHKFRNRLKGKNRVYISQVVRVIDSLIGYLQVQLADTKSDGIVCEKDVLAGKGVDQTNLFKLIHYLQESKLARKVEGYAAHAENLVQAAYKTSSNFKPIPESSTPVIHHLTSLLFALTHPQKEGRLFFSKSHPENITIRFLLLDASTHFQEIVSSARAVILAGGTMSPMSDYTSYLFPYLSSSDIKMLSCGHVIPPSNLLVWNLSKGPTGQEFEFTFKHRNDTVMLDELGRVLLNICTVVPDGVVVFFPSYNYLGSILARWALPFTSGEGKKQSIIARLSAKKSLFQENKDLPVEKTLQSYADAISAGHGGLLFSVIGGKMSEGINFSDGLGRCVVIIGLPYPNINSAEWKAKIEYVEQATVERLQGGGSHEGVQIKAKEMGRDFYENACMRAVNQSLGRAIRHKADYAAIVMVDRRFEGERVKGKLPGWIKEGLVPGTGDKNFGALMGGLSGFFRGKKAT